METWVHLWAGGIGFVVVVIFMIEMLLRMTDRS